MNIPCAHGQRAFGKSGYSLAAMITLAWNSIVSYTSLPLTCLGVLGGVGFFVSCLFILAVVVRRMVLSIGVPGYASTVILITLFGSLNLLGIGIVGEYLIRIIREQNKPRIENLFVTRK